MKKNVDPHIVGRTLTRNIFKNMNDCTFVIVVVGSDLPSDTITKVLESLVRRSSMLFPTLGFFSE